MTTLEEIYQRYSVHGPDVGHGDKGGLHSYITEYEQLLAPYRQNCKFMEIGLALGLSVAMWNEYFEEGHFTGADLSINFNPETFPAWDFVECDATKPEFLGLLGDKTFDVVIEDGSHMTADQIATRDLLLPRMNPGGLYIIEDILNLEATRHLFPGAEIRDLRKNKGRFDDVLIIYHT